MPPKAGSGVSVICVPAGARRKHLLSSRPQTIPAGELPIVPGPLTVSASLAVFRTNDPLTVLARSRTTKQLGAVPTQPPRQRSKAKKRSGVAVNETTVPRAYRLAQREPQSIPPSRLATAPSNPERTIRRTFAKGRADAPATVK